MDIRNSPRPFLMSLAALGISLAAATWQPALGAASTSAPPKSTAESDAGYQQLLAAANAVVGVKTRALSDARSSRTLGAQRSGSGVLIAPSGLVLTIGYLILEADQVEIVTSNGREVPASVVAYDHATGFGLLRPLAPIDAKPIRVGASAKVDPLDRMMIAAGAGEDGVSVATVVAKRQFTGYWEYLIDGAIFTSPPRLDHSGAALINRDGELVGIGSLFVMDAVTPGERAPGNMFVPVDLLKPILDEMIATGRQRATRPWLGLSSLEDEGRIKILRVSDEGPADQAGLKPGDIILAVSGQKVETLADFYRKIWASGAPGVELTLKILQGADVRDIKVRTIDRVEFIRKKPTI